MDRTGSPASRPSSELTIGVPNSTYRLETLSFVMLTQCKFLSARSQCTSLIFAISFDFGGNNTDGSTGEPYIRLVAKTDPIKAKQQVQTIRSATMANMPPEIDPATLITYLTGSSSPSSSDSSDNVAAAEADGSGTAAVPTPTGNHKAFSADINASGVNITIDESLFKKYGLIAIALLGLNCVIGIVLIVLGVLACMRRGSSRKSASGRSAPVYVPVKTSGDHVHDDYAGYQKPYSQ
jgi:saccharopepsin